MRFRNAKKIPEQISRSAGDSDFKDTVSPFFKIKGVR